MTLIDNIESANRSTWSQTTQEM